MHGARGGAPKGKLNGNYKSGRFTAEVMQATRYVRALARLANEIEADPKEARRKVEAAWEHAKAKGKPAGNHLLVEPW